jgi:hypothetical protein
MGDCRPAYPQDNIIFEDSHEAVLIQNKEPVISGSIDQFSICSRLVLALE